ncbi:ribose ABC transporter ATP-binding protein RbsA [Leptotrichia sp. oral taxon 223]|uniref:ribose ABC transporter ATP-binding protein RbsA n=1 Tax=Leptotrichia sp. oral taxon 223 TaxID=712363 RepID=UPI0015C06E3A|nr:ribose ABC transporter ATP-binding protein RbsA [Leptotrichia sp. oral taxon 223]NWO18448.1 ribose ABC transporter ATP-binding protein RbsA [Leptotrichia sp. oral taxon 223]
MKEKLLELKGVTKTFPGVIALDNVDFRVYKGRIMALAGENGAGKSTLMKVITGIYTKDKGEIVYKGKNINFSGITDSIEAGIGIIHQELNLLPELSIMENIFLGREIVNSIGKIDYKVMKMETLTILEKLGVDYDPYTKVGKLSIAEQQMVEIAKVLSQNAKLIIMDEPTDALTEKETEKLFKIIKELKESGAGIVYISHRLKEIFEICDDITIFRDGKYIDEKEVSDIDENQLIELMVGRKLENYFPRDEIELGDEILEIKNISNKYVHDVSFKLKKGEILGISGLVGAGRTELCKTLMGSIKKDSGEIILNRKNLKINSEEEALKQHLFYVSEDRKKDGLILGMSVKENMSLSAIRRFENKFLKINFKKEEKLVDSYISKFKIKTPGMEQLIKNLSGGNQQKIAIGKALMTEPEILILDEPTRGIDVGAKRDIYLLINELKKTGISIILISSEMPEIIGLSDRILVMSNGKITAEFDRKEVTQEKLMKAAVVSL